MRRFLLLISFVAGLYSAGSAQDFSNKGKDFYIPFLAHDNGTNSVMGVYITSDVAATGTITVGSVNIPFSVTPNQVVRKFIGPNGGGDAPNTPVYLSTQDGIQSGAAIHIVSSAPVAVYAHIIFSARSGATLVLPTNVWGKEYIAPSFQNSGNTASFGGIGVMAKVANTVIEITPARNSRSGTRAAGTPYQITLANPGDVYQVQFQGSSDLSGTRIKSLNCQPIGVFSGTTWTGLGCTGASGGDNLYQQLFPTSSWGKTFLTAPFKTRNSDRIRVFVNDVTTVVQKTENGVTTVLTGLITPAAGTGSFYEFTTGSANGSIPNNPTLISADKAISCIQYITSQTCQTPQTVGDPEMIVLNPVEQTINNITVFAAHQSNVPAGQSAVTTCFLNIIIKSVATGSFRINGAVPNASFVAIPGTLYSYLQETLTNPAGVPVQTLAADSAFSAIAYGFGQFESYGYNAGTNVIDLYQQIQVQSQYGIETTPSVCTNSPFKFKVSLPYKPTQLTWDISGLPAGTSPNTNTVVQTPNPACVTYPIPADNSAFVCPDSIRVVNGKEIYWFSLPATYNVTAVGSYNVQITALTNNSDGCGTTQEIPFQLQVSAPPVADFLFTQPGCVAEPVQFTNNTSSAKPTYTWYYQFDYPNATPISNQQNPTFTYSTPGPKQVRFATITTPGCLSDTILKTFTVPAMPSATIAGTTAVCQNGSPQTVTFNGADGASPYIFSYSVNGVPQPDITSTGSSAAITHNPANVGTFNYTLTNVRNAAGTLCTSPVSGQSAIITVNAVPTATISGTASVCQNGAQPSVTFNGGGGGFPFTFTYNINGGPTQTVTTAIGSSVSVSAPTAATGTFTYNLISVTNAQNCSSAASGSATVTVNQLATAGITGNAEVCAGSGGTQVIFTGSGGSTPYTFTYNINGSGNQTLTTTGSSTSASVTAANTTSGTYVYNLVSITESTSNACVNPQSGSVTVTVNPNPTASFTTVAPYCAEKIVTFTPVTSISSGAITQWIWDYGDGSGSQIRTDNNPFTVTYPTPGTKTITLKTVSDKECESPIFSQNITVGAKPEAGFISPEVCLLDPFAQFTDTSKVAAPSSITTWEWNFDDPNATPGNPNTSSNQNPQHTYTVVGTYDVRLIVTTNLGCKDTVDQQVIISDGNPQANFIVQNAANICSKDSVRIQNKSTIVSGVITKIELYWDFVNQPALFDTDNDPAFDKLYAHKYPTLQTDRNYTVRMRSYSGNVCASVRDIIVTVKATPAATFASIPNVCLNNGTVQLTQGGETGGVPGAGVYSGPGVSPTGLFNPLTAGAGTHTLTYTYTSSGGCDSARTQVVVVLAAPVAQFTTVGSTCEDVAVTFTQTSTSTAGTVTQWTYDWGDGSGPFITNTPGDVTHVYANPGPVTATLVVTTSDGCRSTAATHAFSVNAKPLPDFTFSPTACLPNALINFTNTTPSISNWTYNWDFEQPGGPASTQVNPAHTYTALGPHSVKLTATSPATGCSNSTIKSVNTIHPAPFASFVFNRPNGVCEDSAVSVLDQSTFADGTPVSWTWNFGDGSGSVSGQAQPPRVFSTPGSYPVKLTIVNSFGCIDDTVRQLSVHPFPEVNAGPDLFVLEGGQLPIMATATGDNLTFQWTPGTNLSSTTVLQPIVMPTADRTYTLKVINGGGCSGTDQVFVKVLRFPEIPNTFTPNNDGIHDFWEIKYLFTYPGNRVQVFTRTGEKVFESRGYTKAWDGTQNGKSLPLDTYYYIIEPGSGRAPITGYVTIVK